MNLRLETITIGYKDEASDFNSPWLYTCLPAYLRIVTLLLDWMSYWFLGVHLS